MTVKELKQLLEGVDNEMEVLIPLTEEFDGLFTSPCMGESGVSEMGFEDEILGEKMEDRFMLVPHGFFDEQHGVDPDLN